MYDDAYTRNEDGELAVRTVNVTEGSNSSSYDEVFTRDTNGKLALRVTGSGGGSSLPDQTGHAGEFLTTNGTEASWGAVINDNATTSLTQTWSANKLNTMIGDIESLLAQI